MLIKYIPVKIYITLKLSIFEYLHFLQNFLYPLPSVLWFLKIQKSYHIFIFYKIKTSFYVFMHSFEFYQYLGIYNISIFSFQETVQTQLSNYSGLLTFNIILSQTHLCNTGLFLENVRHSHVLIIKITVKLSLKKRSNSLERRILICL